VPSNRQAGVGLFDADGAPDTALRRSDGTLWLYPGNGPGGMTTGRKIAAGMAGYNWLIGLGDLDGDRRPDLLGRGKGGALWLLPGSGFGDRRVVGVGFNDYDLAG
jgi:hypothetical protein